MQEAVERVERVVAALAALELDGLSDGALRELLRGLQRPLGRLGAARTRVAAELERRAVVAAGPGKESGAKHDARRQMVEDLRITPSEMRRISDTGRGLRHAPAVDEAYREGELTDRHAAVITDTLGQLRHLPPRRFEAIEAELVELAGRMDAVALGRHARRRVAEADLEQAERAAQRRHLRRSARVTQTPDGGVAFSGVLYGVQGERLLTAFDAFRTPDLPGGEVRTPEQRGADAFDQILEVALRAGDAPTQHGVRPHVLILVEWSQLAQAAGVAELGFSGPITISEIRPLLRDCSFSRIVLGPDSVPVEVSKHVRTVPQGLFRAVLTRDRGCTWPGCDVPPGWCDVAHGDVPFRNQGRLTLANAALLCRRHHRRLDAGGWQMSIDGASVSYQRCERPKAASVAGGAGGRGRKPEEATFPGGGGATAGNADQDRQQPPTSGMLFPDRGPP